MKCHEFYFDRIEQTYNNKLLFLFRLDMCRRSHANDVCNRGTAGNFYGKRDLLEPKCFFILMFFLYLFSWMWIFCTVLFTFYPTTSKSILFLPLLHTKTNILSLYCSMFTFFYFSHVHIHAIIFFIHQSFFFSLPSPQWKKFARIIILLFFFLGIFL